MLEYYQENTLSDSYIFDTINPNKQITMTVLSAIKDCIFLTDKNIEEQLLQIKSSRLSPLNTDVIKAFENGDINIVYSNKTTVPSTIPFFITKIENSIKGIIFINRFGRKRENDTIDINYRTLYVLMESCFIALKYTKNPNIFERNIGLMKICTKIYSSMGMRILNKEFSLSVMPELYESINYCFARFFLERVWMLKSTTDIIHTYALMPCIQKPADIDLLKMDYTNANITDIVDLITFIKSQFPRTASITMRYYMERFINTYYQSALLSMDTLPYLFFVVITTLLGGFLMSQPIMTDILRTIPTLKSFYPEMSKLV